MMSNKAEYRHGHLTQVMIPTLSADDYVIKGVKCGLKLMQVTREMAR